MNSFNLYSKILRGAWYIDKEAALSYLPIVANILNKNQTIEKQDYSIGSIVELDNPKAQVPIAPYKYRDGFREAQPNSVAVINLKGALMKDNQECGPIGMATIGNIVKEADATENIVGIVFRIDSPGGTVDGTETLANIIFGCESYTLGFVDGMMGSAALWLGVSCNEVVASNETDIIGSVGTMMSIMDVQPALEKMGVKFHDINADQSPEKNKIFKDVRKGKYKQIKNEMLNPMADRFINAVKKNRPKVKEEQLTGKIYLAEKVIGTFIDGITDFDGAINIAQNGGISGSIVKIKKNNEIASTETSDKIEDKLNINNKNDDVMNKSELQAKHPEVYNEIYNDGVKAGASTEKDRVGAYLAFADADLTTVKAGIESGSPISATQISELSMAMVKKQMLNAETGADGKGGANKEEVVVTASTDDVPAEKTSVQLAEEKTIDALGNRGINLKSDK